MRRHEIDPVVSDLVSTELPNEAEELVMARFITRMRNFTNQEDGATMVEYGLMVALIAVVCLVAVTALGVNVAAIFQEIADSVTTSA